MPIFAPFPDFGGAIQNQRLLLKLPRDSLNVTFEQKDRTRVVEALSYITQDPNHPSSQWLLEQIAPYGGCFQLDTCQKGWRKILQRLMVLFDPLPSFTRFVYDINSFSFSREPLELLIASDPNQFMKVAKVIFAQSKYLSSGLKGYLANPSLMTEAVESFLTELEAYCLTIEPSMIGVGLLGDWRNLVLEETVELGERILDSLRNKTMDLYLLLLLGERLIFLDDHPIKKLLKDMYGIPLFQRDFIQLSLNLTDSNPTFYGDLKARGVLTLREGRQYRKTWDFCSEFIQSFESRCFEYSGVQ